MLTEAIDYRNAIESLFQVTRDNNGLVTGYGIMGKYVYDGGYEDTAFTAGATPLDVISVSGIELVLPYPDVQRIGYLGRQVFTENVFSLSIVIRDDSALKARNAILLLERSGYFDGLRYSFQDGNPKVGNFPQWYCQWNQWIFRDIIIN